MKKAVTIYMDDDSEVEAVSVVLCTVKDGARHATGMYSSQLMHGNNAIYVPYKEKIIEFREEEQ